MSNLIEAVDHVDAAQKLLARTFGMNLSEAAIVTHAAEVHATLALVEQQRIANRIALAAVRAEESRHYAQHGAAVNLIGDTGLFDNPTNEYGPATLKPEIARALGIGGADA